MCILVRGLDTLPIPHSMSRKPMTFIICIKHKNKITQICENENKLPNRILNNVNANGVTGQENIYLDLKISENKIKVVGLFD